MMIPMLLMRVMMDGLPPPSMSPPHHHLHQDPQHHHHDPLSGLRGDAVEHSLSGPVGACRMQQVRRQLRLRAEANLLVVS